MTDLVRIFKDSSGEWRWHRQSENGRIVSEGGEGYANRKDVEDMARSLNAGSAVRYEIEEESGPRPLKRNPVKPLTKG